MPVRPGEPLRISARDWNDVLGMLAERRALRGAFGGGALVNPLNRQSQVLVRNDGEDPVVRFGALELVEPIFTPADNAGEFLNRVSLVGQLPTGSAGPLPVLIPQAPIGPGRIGLCTMDGATVALVNVVDERHTWADTADGVGTLQSGWSGCARIVWKEPGTGTKKALVILGQRQPEFDAVVVTASQIGSSWRWTYAFTEVVFGTDGEALTDAEGLRVGTFLNETERYNASTAPKRIAPGVLQSDYTNADIEALRLPDGLPVKLREVWPAGWIPGQLPVYKLYVPNAPLVTCT